MSFPGGSKKKVNRAGERIRKGNFSDEDITVLEEWRTAHAPVLNTFQAILRNRTKGTGIAVAQRHKRKSTIVHKLNRYRTMKLSRMDDVAGCRLIFDSIDQLYAFRDRVHDANFRHRIRHDYNKYDYIKRPKSTGYRGIHDVYEYDVRSEVGKRLKGLYVEVQYRTKLQHAWSTAVEVIGFITESQPKFEEGDERYKVAMAFASEILARAFENRTGPLPEMPTRNLLVSFRNLEKELGLLNALRGLNAVEPQVFEGKNTILIIGDNKPLRTKSYKSAPEALRALFMFEKAFPNHDIVLVRADTADEVRLAFKNYYSDAQDFIGYIDTGCQKLLIEEALK